MLTRMCYRLSCFLLLCTGKAADLHKAQRSGQMSLGQLVEEANEASNPEAAASVSVAALGQMHVHQKGKPSGSQKNSFSIVRSDATAVQTGHDLPFSATANFAEQTPTSTDAWSRCVIPMWGPELYVCEEAKDVEAAYTWTDTNGHDRKSMANGGKCTISCPEAGYWKTSTVLEMHCSNSKWQDEAGGEIKEIKCKPSKFVFLSVALFFAMCCLCTGVGFTKGARAHMDKQKTKAEIEGMHDPNSPYYDPNAGYYDQQEYYGYDQSGHHDPNAGHYDPNAGHYDPNAGHYDPHAQQQHHEQPTAGSYG